MKKTISVIALVVILLGIAPQAMATAVNSNSKIQDDIEYYVQTDKAVYDLGENVEMLYRITNLSVEDVTFGPLPMPEWNFWVEKDGEYIWKAVNVYWGMQTEFTLSPGESKEFPAFNYPYVWNMRDDENNLVTTGDYSVIGGLYHGLGYYDYTKVNVPIEIVPEPTTFLFTILGAIALRAKHRSKTSQYNRRRPKRTPNE